MQCGHLPAWNEVKTTPKTAKKDEEDNRGSIHRDGGDNHSHREGFVKLSGCGKTNSGSSSEIGMQQSIRKLNNEASSKMTKWG